MSKLLNPCPFCGSTDLKHYVSNARDRECGVIVCKSCGARLEACSVSHAELVNRGYSDHEAEIAQKEMASGLICDKWNLRARRTCQSDTQR